MAALHFSITSSMLPDHATVAAFHGIEGISRPYVFDVYVVVSKGAEVEMDDAPGAKATLTISDGADGSPPVHVSGIIASLELLRSVSIDGKAEHENSLYLVRIVPNLWQLTLSRHSRIWTKKTIPDIIKDVLQAEGVDKVELKLNGSYDPEEHVCQYKESSLAFIERWMEREGMYYYFEQSDSGETLVITDNKATATPSPKDPIRYHTGGVGDVMSGAHLDTFTWRNNATAASIKFTEYDYLKPALDVTGKASVSKLGVAEQVTYGQRFFTAKQGNSLASIRAEDLLAQAKTYHGGGAVVGITAGYKFTVEQHPRSQLNAEYLAVSVEHTANAPGNQTWGKAIPFHDTTTYRVEVSAISGDQQYRHPETVPWPRLDGFENAIVDGPATSDYAQIDDQGRYNLKFKFDEGTLKDGKASTWVRKMQPHAGTVEGWHFPERAGTEVVCAFLGGDPDRPIIVGALPTAIHQSPVTKNNHTQNVIQTGGKNRFEMEDLAGQQRVTISTPHQKTFLHLGSPLSGLSQVFSGEGDSAGAGGGTESHDIPDHHAAIVSDGNALIMTCGNQDIESGANWSVHIAENHVEKIDGNRVDEVKGFMKQTITGLLDQDVHGAVSEEYHSTLEQDVQGAVTEDYKSTLKQTVAAAVTVKHEATFNHTVEGAVTEEFGPTETHIKGIYDLKVDANKIWRVGGFWENSVEGPKSETIMGAVVNMFLGLKTELVGGAEAKIIVGGKLEVIGGASLEIQPSKLKFELEEGHFVSAHTQAKAMEEKLAAMEESISGVEETTCGIGTVINGLSQKQSGLDSKLATLISELGGLHTKA